MSHAGWMAMRSLTRDDSVKDRKLAPGTARRVASYARPFRREIGLFLVLVIIDSALVVATPTYKASFTGLLKIFLDQIDAGELAGIPTVALMTGGSDAHALAVLTRVAPVRYFDVIKRLEVVVRR